MDHIPKVWKIILSLALPPILPGYLGPTMAGLTHIVRPGQMFLGSFSERDVRLFR